jgi:hypothetical protein
MIIVMVFGIAAGQEILSLSIKSMIGFLIVLALGWSLLKVFIGRLPDEIFEVNNDSSEAEEESFKGANVDLTIGEKSEQAEKRPDENVGTVKSGIERLIEMPGVGENPMPDEMPVEIPEEKLELINLIKEKKVKDNQ